MFVLSAFFVFIALCCLGVIPAGADHTSHTAAQVAAPATHNSLRSVHANIQSVDEANNKIILRTKNGPMIELSVSPSVPIHSGHGKALTLHDLRNGDDVQVRYLPV